MTAPIVTTRCCCAGRVGLYKESEQLDGVVEDALFYLRRHCNLLRTLALD